MRGRADAAGAPVWQIDGLDWEGQAVVDPVGEALPVGEWLASLPEEGLALRLLPVSRIKGGVCDGGHVLLAQGAGGRVYFAVPAAAIPALEGHLPADDYAELVRRTPALWGAG